MGFFVCGTMGRFGLTMKRKSLLLLFISFSLATTIYIPEDYPTIQEGIDNAQSHDTVLVTSGTYLEQVTITNSLTLAAYENVIIDGSGYDYVISISADTVTISGFEIVGDTLTVSGIIVRPGSDNVQLLSNVIHGMKLPNQNSDILASYGILAYGLEDIVPDPPSNLIIDNNEIYDINAFGISLGTFTDSVYIKNNYIHWAQ